MSLHGAMQYTPRLSAPRCPISVLAPENLGAIPNTNAKVLVLSIYLPAKREGWPKAMRHENACLLSGQNLDYHSHCPPKGPIKFQETSGTVTHALQVLHTLLWHQPLKNERALLYCGPHRGLPTLTRYLVAFMQVTQAIVAHL